jgi:hypothetical protein
MTNHACPRCGLETTCSHGSWADRHPAGAVTAGLFTLTLMSMMLSTHPIAALTVITLSGVALAARAAYRHRRRREALATRADWEHAALMAVPVPPARPLPQRHPHTLPWRTITFLRTQPVRAARNASAAPHAARRGRLDGAKH